MSYKLNVPYREKDEAKALGAKWNAQGRFWYCPGELTPALRRWYIEDNVSEKKAEDVRPAFFMPGSDLLIPEFEKYKTVSQVNDMIVNHFRAAAEFQVIMVKGEVTDFSGHNGNNYYFALKDEESLLPCFMWESVARSVLGFELKMGQQVAVIGSLELYRARGKSQLVVRSIINIGEGDARLKFLQLKAKLEAQGLFDQAHKKPIPRHPRKVGIVTSKDGQARKDIEKVAGKRNPYVQLILYHVNVQGRNAVSTIIQGIKTLDSMGLDTIIVGRGGGSEEELMAYNDEMVARAVFEARTPIISAVGHEGNILLIDYVSDKRVATPTEAAQESVPDVMTEIKQIDQLQKNIADNMRNCLRQRELLLDARIARLESLSPARLLEARKERLALLTDGLRQKILKAVSDRVHRYEVLTANLHGLSPTAKLVRGFGYISKNDRPVASVIDVDAGDEIIIRIHDGQIMSTVTGTLSGQNSQ